jgi:hypothetical protein
MNDWELKLEEIFGKKAPAMPANIKEMIVKYGPYITLVILVMAAVPLLGIIGLGAVAAPFALMGGVGEFTGFSLSMITLVVTLVLEVMALPFLFKRQMKGWRFMLYSTLVSAVSALLSFNLGSLVIGTGIGLYILYQIKPLYK